MNLAIRAGFALVVAACGGSRPAPVAPTEASNAAGAPASRDALVDATLAALVHADASALARLTDVDTAMTRATTCDGPREHRFDGHSARERFGALLDRIAGTKLELVRVARDEVTTTATTGEQLSKECRVSTAFTEHRVDVEVHVAAGSAARTGRVELVAVEVGGAWYLAARPVVFLGDMLDLVGKMREYADKFCGCTNRGCIDNVNAEMQAWTAEHRDELQHLKPNDDDLPRLQELSAAMSTCLQRARAP
jgi:hypothetical protein